MSYAEVKLRARLAKNGRNPENNNAGIRVGGDLHLAEMILAERDSLLEALKMARECIAYCRRAHSDAQSGTGIPVEIFIDAAIAKTEG